MIPLRVFAVAVTVYVDWKLRGCTSEVDCVAAAESAVITGARTMNGTMNELLGPGNCRELKLTSTSSSIRTQFSRRGWRLQLTRRSNISQDYSSRSDQTERNTQSYGFEPASPWCSSHMPQCTFDKGSWWGVTLEASVLLSD